MDAPNRRYIHANRATITRDATRIHRLAYKRIRIEDDMTETPQERSTRASSARAKRSQRKGKRGEQVLARMLNDIGVPARRTAPLQAGFGRQKDVADVSFGPHYEYTAECKTVANGYKSVYKALGDADLLVIKVDNRKAVYVLSESFAKTILPLMMEVDL